MEDKLDKYCRRLFYLESKLHPAPTDLSCLEYFGVFRITNPLEPNRKLWLTYSCLQSEIPEVGDKVRRKYGKKHVCELLRKPVYSGFGVRRTVSDYFSNLKWATKGNFLEAPAQSHYNDERMTKTINNLLDKEQKRLYDYMMTHHDWFKRYNDQKPPPRY
ncbi:hypothetical protein KR018_010294 [Drosophila ironensis]|nr:hypothetical protein KR018_010294 [Drosophila ironensis]